MKNLFVGLGLCALLVGRLHGATYWVATDGDDANAGTSNAPLATPQKAVGLSTLAPGDMIYVRGGTYTLSSQVKPSKAGTPENYIKLWAFKNEKPIFDFAGLTNRGMDLGQSYWHVRGMEVKNVDNNGIGLKAGYIILEGCVAHDNSLEGIKLTGSSGTNGANHCLVLNCDSYRNYDSDTHGENADGFAAKDHIGSDNIFSGCRAWHNADDGWDFYGATFPVTITNCWAFLNGIDLWGEGTNFEGDGNGFKLGGNGDTQEHRVYKSLAFDNPAKGFHQNHTTAGQTVINCTAFNNQYNFNFNEAATSGTLLHHVLKNNISFNGQENLFATTEQVSNSWQGFTVTGWDFVSEDSSTNVVLQPRNADFSLPDINLVHLVAGSDLIDGGVNVGFPFSGAAPDLGAFEFDNGGVVQTPAVFDLTSCRPTESGFQLAVGNLNSHGQVVLFVSTNLTSWKAIATNPAVTGTTIFYDSGFGSRPLSFYRVLEE